MSGRILCSVFLVATCGLIYELIAGALASYLMGDSVTQFSLVIGTYLFAMGVGSYAVKFIDKSEAQVFLTIELILGVVGGTVAAFLMYMYFAGWSFQATLLIAVAVIGMLVGAEIPLALRILQNQIEFKDLVSRVLGLDYLGALAASLLFPLWLVPSIGILRTGLLFGLINIFAALLAASAMARSAYTKALPVAAGLALLLTVGFVYAPRFERFFDEQNGFGITLYSKNTSYQRIHLVRSGEIVRLFLNGNLQFSSDDEYRYHEALVHPGLASVRKATISVLVLGGGDGLAAREILRDQRVQKIDLIDLDPGITEIFRKDPGLVKLNQNSLNHPKLTVHNLDAFRWLKESPPSTYDFVVVDFPDPSNFAVGKLYTTTFFESLKQHLAPDGLLVVQSSSPYFAKGSFWCIDRTLTEVGIRTLPYHALVPSFGEWGFVMGGHKPPRLGYNYPENLRFVNYDTVQQMLVFAPDMLDSSPKVNRLSNQVLVRIFNEEWQEHGRL